MVREAMRADRQPTGCRYVIGDVRQGNWRFCQKPVLRSSYCPEHDALCIRARKPAELILRKKP